MRPYEPGDDVRRIDWNVTARTGVPHVRVELAERVLVTWLVLDASASMAFGTADRRKADVAEGVALAVGHAATRRGNRLGPSRSAPRPAVAPPAAGPPRPAATRCACCASCRPAAAARSRDALELADGLATQRSLVVIVSDFRGPLDWRAPLLRLAGRHTVLAVEIRDPREQELADVGELRLVDPETGRQLRVDTGDRRLRERFAAAAREERRGLVASLASAGVRHVALSTEGDWLRPLAAFLRRRDARPGELRARRPAALPARRAGRGRGLSSGSSGAATRARRRGRRRRCCRTWSTRPPAWRRHVPTALFLLGLTLLLVGFARPQATITVKQQEATRRARARRLGLDGREGRRSRRGSRPRGPPRCIRRQGCRRLPHVALVTFSDHATLASPPTHDLTRVSRCARARPHGPAGHGARRRGRRARSRVARAVHGEAGRKRPPAAVLVLSDGGQTTGR